MNFLFLKLGYDFQDAISLAGEGIKICDSE